MCLFLFITLYMFRAHSAYHQEKQIVSMQPLVTVFLLVAEMCAGWKKTIPGESIRHFKHWKFTRLVQWIVKVESKFHGAVGCKMSPLIGDMGHMLLPWNPRAPTFISCRRIILVFFCYLLLFLSYFFLISSLCLSTWFIILYPFLTSFIL
jgi:hypothetical protein